jgi:hypothetical protein
LGSTAGRAQPLVRPFERYRLAGPSRSLLHTVNAERAEKGKKRKTKVPGAWNQAFARWRWRQRAEAWDEQERHQARLAHAQAREEMNRRHVQVGQAMQNKGLLALKSREPGELSPTHALRYLVEGTKLERSARGAPETAALDQDRRAAIKHPDNPDYPEEAKLEGMEWDLNALSTAELEKLHELQEKVSSARPPQRPQGNGVADPG